MALVVLASCNKKELLPVAYINVAEGSTFTPAEVSAEGAEVAINFSTNYQWQIRGYSTLGFCSIDVLNGEAGDAGIVVTVDPNTTGVVRSAEFSILAGAAVQTVTITQTETNSVAVDAVNYTVPAEGGTVEIVVSHNVDYVVNIPSEYTWIREVPQSKVMQTSYVTLEVDSNPEWIERTATGLTITGKDVFGNDIVNEFNIVQPAGAIETIWNKTFSEDWPSIPVSGQFHVGYYGGDLVMTNGDGIHAVDPATGEYVGTVEIPGLSIAPQSFASDDAGNLVFAANADCASQDFTVYAYDGTDVSELATYGAGNLYTGTLGNLRVVGDIKSKAVVTAFAASVNYCVAWQIENGAVTKTLAKPTPYTNDWGVSSVLYGVVSPVSDDLSDGLFFAGYAGDPYYLYYNPDPDNATKENWEGVFLTDCIGNENLNSISIAEYNGVRYCAIGQSDFFGYSEPKVYLVDITDLSNASLAYTTSVTRGSSSTVGVNDVKIVVDNGIMRLYVVDAGYDVAACVEFPH